MLQSSKSRGQSLILFTVVCVFVIIPVIGLAIDGAINFWVKAKLSAAVDAAALAAGRNPTANANTTVQQYVYANFPAGWMGTTFSVAPVAAISFPQVSVRKVTVNASVIVPLRFMGILGFKQSTVSAVAVSSRRNTNVILVLDRSGSMNMTGPDGAVVCNTMIASATTFVNNFTNGLDQIGLISFHTWANVDFPISTNFQTSNPNLITILGDLVCGANTSSAMALNLAYTQIQNLGAPAYASNGALNVIVFFTDGNPNGVTGTFRPKAATDARYYASTTGNYINTIDSTMPATANSCISALPNAAPGVIIQGANGAATGLTQGLFQIYGTYGMGAQAYISPTIAPTNVCGSGQSRTICDTDLTVVSASGCHFQNSPADHLSVYPTAGQTAPREDVAYIPRKDYFGNATVNASFMTQSTDVVPGTPYASSGAMRADTPQSVMDASFNAADAQALAIISDTVYKPTIYTIGLGGASDVASEAVFQTFLQRVANDPSSNRPYNSSLPTGLFVYAPDDTQLATAFHQIASQILRLSR
jgi:Flp pilus assembly protein TadG